MVYNREDFIDIDGLDLMFIDTALLVIQKQKCSPKLLQKELGLFYARAKELIGYLQKAGVIGEMYKKKKDVLYTESSPVIMVNEIQLYEMLYHPKFIPPKKTVC
jgi:Ftsk gamma domain